MWEGEGGPVPADLAMALFPPVMHGVASGITHGRRLGVSIEGAAAGGRT